MSRVAVNRGSVMTTRGVAVTVVPRYLVDESDPVGTEIRPPMYVFGYAIRIHNQGPWSVKLLRRRWEIVDGAGELKVVEGDGVVGQQPEIGPDGHHEYASYVPIHTEWGTMEGHFVMVYLDGPEAGTQFLAGVKRWYLVAEE
ncbi:MAG: Co2+/Mg2+ efflux protein ApaG [Planctomycetes bacterium]|nr:Co2+/Mg2+ efflux protein ApaG [Planctomycetota bacterium]